MSILLPYLAALALLLIGSAFFSGSESAMFSLDRYALDRLDPEGRRTDRSIGNLLAKPRRLLATILLGNELVNISLSTVGLAMIIGGNWLALTKINREFAS